MEKRLESPRKEPLPKRNLSTRAATAGGYQSLERFDRRFFRDGVRVLAGVDEAGRGALAGPVVAAAVVLPPFPGLVGVDDSKQVREEQREELFSQIVGRAISVGIAFGDADLIDRSNILLATLSVMARAVRNLKVVPDAIIVDGPHRFDFAGQIVAVPGGDKKSLSIAAASILAKVARDRLMRKLHKRYPAYNFLKNKGYGTREHIDAIFHHGLISEHRKSYRLKRIEKSRGIF